MRIALPPERALREVRVGVSGIPVEAFGHTYTGRVLDVARTRARVAFRTKRGTEYRRWITIPGLSRAERTNEQLRVIRIQRDSADRKERTAAALRRMAARIEANGNALVAERYRENAARLEREALAVRAVIEHRLTAL